MVLAANMLRLPRTAQAHKKQAQQQPGGATQPAGADPPPASPTAVLNGVPRRTRSSKAVQRGWAADQPAPEGHAQDVLHLLQSKWFGPLSRSKAATATELPFADSDEEPPLPPPRRRQAQGQGQPGVAAAAGGANSSDTSLASGSSQQSADGSTSSRQQRGATVSRPILSQRQRDAAAAAAIQDLPGIGTWAGRYRLFGQKPQQGDASAGPAAAAAAGAAPTEQQQQQEQEREPTGAGLLQPGQAAGSFGSPVVLRPGGFDPPGADERALQREWQQQHQHRPAYGSEQAQEDAWRWRFRRKWATEQQRFYEVEAGHPASMVSDDLEAMLFTQACGTGVNLQVMPTSAVRPSHLAASAGEEGHLGIEASTSALSLCQFDVEASYMSGGPLSATMSPAGSTHGGRAAAAALQRTSSGAGVGAGPSPFAAGAARRAAAAAAAAAAGGAAPSPRGPSATRTVLSMASKARDLLQKQGAIEAEVEGRWERTRSAGGGEWVGASLQPVRIDMFGRFKFCVLRVSDSAGHTRFLVRGRAGAGPAALLEAARQEAAEVSRADGLPPVALEAVGGGMMEWREDTDRELYLQPSAQVGEAVQQQRSDSPTKAPYLNDVSGLTASLVRQALPCHFRITTAASAGRSASASIPFDLHRI